MENKEVIIEKKNNKGIIILLIIIILGLCAYIVYDKYNNNLSKESIQNTETTEKVTQKEIDLIQSYLSTNSDANAFLQVIFSDVSDIDMQYVLGQKYLYGESVIEDCSDGVTDCTVPTFDKETINSLFKTYTNKDISILKNQIPSYNDFKYKTTKYDGGYVNFYENKFSSPNFKIKTITMNQDGNYVIRYDGFAYGYDFSNPFEKELVLKLTNSNLLFISNTKVQ